MKVYIAGKITGLDHEVTNAKFDYAKQFLEQQGHEVLIPTVLPVLTSMSQENYMHICFAMIDVCDAVFMLSDWQQSPGARQELQYATDWKKVVIYQDEKTKEETFPIHYGN
jgi:nucleoside 2-deoxyribosyltransferase